MVGGLTVGALDGRRGEDVFTWILIVWATRGVVIKFCKPSYEERRGEAIPRGRQKQKRKYSK